VAGGHTGRLAIAIATPRRSKATQAGEEEQGILFPVPPFSRLEKEPTHFVTNHPHTKHDSVSTFALGLCTPSFPVFVPSFLFLFLPVSPRQLHAHPKKEVWQPAESSGADPQCPDKLHCRAGEGPASAPRGWAAGSVVDICSFSKVMAVGVGFVCQVPCYCLQFCTVFPHREAEVSGYFTCTHTCSSYIVFSTVNFWSKGIIHVKLHSAFYQWS